MTPAQRERRAIAAAAAIERHLAERDQWRTIATRLIREYADARGITKRKLAGEIEMNRSNFHHAMTGKVSPAETLRRIVALEKTR